MWNVYLVVRDSKGHKIVFQQTIYSREEVAYLIDDLVLHEGQELHVREIGDIFTPDI